MSGRALTATHAVARLGPPSRNMFSVQNRLAGQSVGLGRLHRPLIRQQSLVRSVYSASRSPFVVRSRTRPSCPFCQPLVSQRRPYSPRQNHGYGYQGGHQQPARPFASNLGPLMTWGFMGTCVYIWWQWQLQGGRGNPRQPPSLDPKSGRVFDSDGRQVEPANSRGFPNLQDNFMSSERNLQAGRWWTILSSAVSHRDFMHLAANMITFHAFTTSAWMLGLSPLSIATVGMASAASCSIAQIADFKRKGVSTQALGASGLVAGLAGYVTVIAPRLSFTLFFIPVPIPLYVLTPALLAWDVYNADNIQSSVGHAGHIGGTCCGLAMGLLRRALFRI